MKEENEKHTWETPEIIALDLSSTETGKSSALFESGAPSIGSYAPIS